MADRTMFAFISERSKRMEARVAQLLNTLWSVAQMHYA